MLDLRTEKEKAMAAKKERIYSRFDTLDAESGGVHSTWRLAQVIAEEIGDTPHNIYQHLTNAGKRSKADIIEQLNAKGQ